MIRPSSLRRPLAPLVTLVWLALGGPAAPTAAASEETSPPTYTLAGIDIFGNTRTPDSEVLALLGIKEGDPMTLETVTRLDEKFRASGKFAYTKVSSTSYGDKKTYVTVDLVEKGEESRFHFNPAPTGVVPVPSEILDWMRRYEKASYQLFQTSPRRFKDINEGHYLDSDPGLREYEEKLLEMVPAHYDVLVRALKEDRDLEKRALCALMLGWAKDKQAVIGPLEGALKDPEVQVRTNAARALIPIAYVSVHNNIPFPLDPILEQIRYPTSSDRTKAAALLLHLAGDAANHAPIRDRAGDILVRLAAARQPTQRDYALTILTLISGEKYGRDVEKWKSWWAARKKGASPTTKTGAANPEARPR